ncbi:ABC transporter ATP-binding protein [Propionibacteriaceae bacterium Y2011]
MDPVIEITRVAKSYGDVPVLRELSLRIGPGVFALLGPNGAGKSTMVNILTTLVTPDSGHVEIAGVDVVAHPAAARRVISATGQDAALDDMLTGRENLVLIGRLLGLGADEARHRAGELISTFALTEAADRRASTYSGGMRRRLDLAASLIDQPAVLFLDEPSTGLDPTSRTNLWANIREVAAAGTTVFLTTQYLQEAEELADRIVVLRDGGIVADGTAAELITLVGTASLVLLDDHDQVVRSFDVDGTAADTARVLAGLGPTEQQLRAELRRPTLDDAFIALTSAEGAGRPGGIGQEVAA